MAHEFQSGAFAGTPAWHGLGTVVPNLMSTKEALKISGVGGLITRPETVFIQLPNGDFKAVPDYTAVVSDDENNVLGIHSGGYVKEEFSDAFNSLGDTFGPDAKIWETMVLLRHGKIAAGVLRFPEFDRELVDGSH